ncbi:hypothetical protein VHEMI01960 [[Torrubiella] hemipterigena]|nr:hypothetical protein VHEMI01960 [[Torrubiella] hemipterigena]
METAQTQLYSVAPALLATPNKELVLPSHSHITTDTSKRYLFDHFHRVICRLIVIQESDSGNAFQRLVAPLCLRSEAVASAIYALASAHLEWKGSLKEEMSIVYHTEAIMQLSKIVNQGTMANQNELLAAVMLLVYHEALVQKRRSSVVQDHLKGAVAIMQSNGGVSSPTGVFLERAFQFYDAITALSMGAAPLFDTSLGQSGSADERLPHVGDAPASAVGKPAPKLVPINTDGVYQHNDSADVLLGFATSLWPTIYRLCRMHQMSTALQGSATIDPGDDDFQALEAELLHTGFEVETELEAWRPPIPKDDGNASGTKGLRYTSSAVHTASAYRHSALVYLYRNVYKEDSRHNTVQENVRASMAHCTATTGGEGPMGALLWPLFVASLEAQKGSQERVDAATAFANLGRRQGMANIGRAWDVVQEVWHRADLADMGARSEQPLEGSREEVVLQWQRISEKMGFTLILG